MRSTWFTRGGRAALALWLVCATVGVTTPAWGKPAPGRPSKRTGLNLFALTFGVLNVNRIFCGINNTGQICVDPTNSPVIPGGFWPKGTPSAYIFQTGLQLAGTIPAGAGFAWAGDTVGAYFMDARGTQEEGEGVTLVYNSLDLGDAAAWPNGAQVRDASVYNAVLLGRSTVSQQDLWVRTWDGNPAFTGNARSHPMGIMVEERGMAWNFPTGNEDILYFVYDFYNVTASDPAVYSGLNSAIRSEIAQIGANYQAANEAAYGVSIPNGGYAITNMFAAFAADMDIGDANNNYSTPVIPFAMGVAYKNNFLEPSWTFPAEIFGAPFVPSPGFVGVKYLRSPLDSLGQPIGLTIFSNTENSATGYPDPTGVRQLYRYLSGGSSPAAGDNPCTFQGQQLVLHVCFLSQTAADTRFFQSSGPLTLNPGEVKTIVVAYILAAPLPPITPGTDVKPGTPASGDSIAANPALVRPIERTMGWLSQSDADSNQIITQDEVQTVPRSLLNKALVAQAVYDNKFLLPFAPDPPRFFVVPGDNQTTIAWQKSETETVRTGGGDPYFAIASDPTSTLYDANFRQYDVEGYRIYRGRTTGALSLVAQFDYAGTSIIDFTGGFAYTTDEDGDGISECAPELGVQDDCPTPFPSVTGVEHPLTGAVVQVPAGGRVQLFDGSVLILQSDTAVSGGASGYPELSDAGVTFAFVDRGVRNYFTYYYAVTAFDVNSVRSGPSSLESPRITKSVTPRPAGSNTTAVALVQGVFGSDGVELSPTAQYPAIDGAAGTFAGNMPAANGAGLLLASAVVEALAQGDIFVRIDSVGTGYYDGFGGPASNLYLTLSAPGATLQRVVPLPEPAFSASGDLAYSFDEALVSYDSTNARKFGIAFTQDVRMPITFGGSVPALTRSSPGISLAAGRYGVGTEKSRYLAHSRWFDATGQESQADPTVTAFPDSFHNSGHLTGVGRIWSPASYRDRWPQAGNADAAGRPPAISTNFRGFQATTTAWYPADFLVTWNADSSITVFDSSNHGTLPFAPNGGSGWGFVNARALIAAGVTAGGASPATDVDDGVGAPDINIVGYHHIYGTKPTCDPWWAIPCAQFEQTAQFEPLDFNYDGVADGNGVVLMVNGEPFFMELSQIPSAGTKWRLRAVGGAISVTSCTVNGTPPATVSDAVVGPDMSDCSGYAYTGYSLRPSFAPGLTYKITVQSQYSVAENASGDLSRVHTVPDPYYVTSAIEQTANTKILKFVNLPSRAIIRVYSLSGVLVQVLTHNDPSGSGEATWNLRNRNNQFVASGVYFYHIEGPDGKTKVGRMTIVNFAP